MPAVFLPSYPEWHHIDFKPDDGLTHDECRRFDAFPKEERDDLLEGLLVAVKTALRLTRQIADKADDLPETAVDDLADLYALLVQTRDESEILLPN